MLNFNIYTTKASEAVQAAHDMALEKKNSNMDTYHLLLAMLDQDDGYVPMILKKLDIDPAIATGPFVTTTNDIVGLLIYLSLLTFFYAA